MCRARVGTWKDTLGTIGMFSGCSRVPHYTSGTVGSCSGLYLGDVDANGDDTAPANVIGKIPASFSGLKKLT